MQKEPGDGIYAPTTNAGENSLLMHEQHDPSGRGAG